MRQAIKECDILVVGGGVSGVCAAVSAARLGAQTLLVERSAFLGGTAVLGMHRFLCGLYLNGMELPRDTLNDGLVREVCGLLRQSAPSRTPQRMGKVYVLPFATKDLVSVFKALTENESCLQVRYGTVARSVIMDGRRIAHVCLQTDGDAWEVAPCAVVDASGNGVIVRSSSAEYDIVPPERRQLAGFSFRVKGLKNVDETLSVAVPHCLARAAINKGVPWHWKYTTFYLGDGREEGLCKVNLPSEDGSRTHNFASEMARSIHLYLVRTLPSFASSTMVEISEEVLEREGLRLLGEYRLTSSDVLTGRKFPDGKVRNAWPIEFWDRARGPRYQYLSPGEYYEIPERCVASSKVSNLFCAGRCISVSQEALGSTRVMGCCMSLGEQASLACLRKFNALMDRE